MDAINLDAQSGIVTTANMVQGVAVVAEAAVGAALAAANVVDLVDGEVALAAGQKGPMRWTNNTSRFVLKEDGPDCY
jgi:hypothetical protein